MLQNWFEVKVKYEKTLDEGKISKVSELYLFDALNFADAENRANEELIPFISGEFIASSIRRARINELFESNGDKWYKAKVYFISLDEEKGVEKRTSCTMLVQADSVKDAWDVLEAGLKGTMADYEVAGINETMILDVYKYKVEEE